MQPKKKKYHKPVMAQVDLKFEFNQSNRGLYGRDAGKSLLDEGGPR